MGQLTFNKRHLRHIYYLFGYVGLLCWLSLLLPQTLRTYYDERTALVSFSIIGFWRFGWWLNHALRASIYAHVVFPRRRRRAQVLWNQGWRPQRLYFMLTTYQEIPATTHRVLQSIIDECSQIDVPIKLFIGIGAAIDAEIIQNFFAEQPLSFTLEIVLVKQHLPGKRYAIGATLRSMQRHNLQPDDIVIFMDGDTYFMPQCLALCLPFFPLFPRMQALTTYETAHIINGPTWLKNWLDLRFAQRDLTMRSYALSDKILTLTGRMSIFRGTHLCEPDFLDIIENDHLKHWLWGEYRFLSGDDKSTWYYLLKHKADMFYIPDACTVTIEHIQGSAFDRMKENLRRWSGNTLRNGARAIALGPRTVGWFIWWCLIDQRCAIWTMLIGHFTILALGCSKSPFFLLAALLWIAISRLLIATVLSIYARRFDMTFPFILYINQLLSSLIKIYILFRLPQQRWKNRGNQHAGFANQPGIKIKNWVASYLTFFYCSLCLFIVLKFLHLVTLPTFKDIKIIFD